jgi:hypothetical protein
VLRECALWSAPFHLRRWPPALSRRGIPPTQDSHAKGRDCIASRPTAIVTQRCGSYPKDSSTLAGAAAQRPGRAGDGLWMPI